MMLKGALELKGKESDGKGTVSSNINTYINTLCHGV